MRITKKVDTKKLGGYDSQIHELDYCLYLLETKTIFALVSHFKIDVEYVNSIIIFLNKI